MSFRLVLAIALCVSSCNHANRAQHKSAKLKSFQLLDQDSDGRVSKEEWSLAIEHAAAGSDINARLELKAAMEELFERADKNSDNALSSSEWLLTDLRIGDP